MSNVRVDTIRRMLDAGEEESDEILEEYARKKGLRSSKTDTYEGKRGNRVQLTTLAVAGARSVLKNSDLTRLSKEEVEHYKETLAKLGDIIVGFSNDKTEPYRRVKLFSRLLELITGTNYEIVHTAAFAIFKELESRAKVRPPAYMRNEIYKPLAVAIGMKLQGFPGDTVHDTEFRSFIETYFVGEIAHFGNAVLSEYESCKHSVMRSFRFECQPEDRKRYKASHSSLELAHNWILAKLETRNRVR